MTMPGSRNKPAPPLLRLSPVNRDRIYCFVGLASWDGHPFTSACTAPPASVGTPPSRQSRFPINSTACCFRAARRKIKQAQAEPSMCRSRRRRSGGDGKKQPRESPAPVIWAPWNTITGDVRPNILPEFFTPTDLLVWGKKCLAAWACSTAFMNRNNIARQAELQACPGDKGRYMASSGMPLA